MAQDDIQGTVTDSAGDPVEGAIVALIPNDGSDGDDVIYTTTDSNGDYIFDAHPQGDGTTQEWHVMARYDDGSGEFNSLSLPYVSADLPEGGTIPDSAIVQYDAQSAFGSGDDGNAISTWNDALGNHDVTGGSPIVRSNGINGNISVEFDGTDDDLDTGFSTESQPNTILAVIEPFTIGPDFEVFVSGDTTRHELGTNAGDNDDQLQEFAGSNTLFGGYSANTPIIVGGIFDGTNSELRVDGQTVDTGDVGGNGLDGVTLGTEPTTSGRYFEGYIGEVVIYNDSLSLSDLDSEEERLADKWGITI